MQTGFIAETDGSGRVVWVWRQGPGERIAKPVAEPAACAAELEGAACYGAPRDAISAWFAEVLGDELVYRRRA